MKKMMIIILQTGLLLHIDEPMDDAEEMDELEKMQEKTNHLMN